ncbi:DUF4430 domain-containing protein [Bacillus lacus]|uniref:DUF4430 domain-containing protein n=1 Tax=Metabacillus lacus TaxID=1983721 RepID=A0A7X2LW36_9BACI|nr:DUF4430 domain-containing protein [Metabacillus lacus]MRX71045.1 DUF4430 domain-containing protein [Metabacillus lacus]
MNKYLMVLMSLVLAVLTACAPAQTDQNDSGASQQPENGQQELSKEAGEELSASIKLTKDQKAEELSSKEVVFEGGESLMEVMNQNFEVEDEAGFITSIDGIEANADEKYAWMFDVNGEPAMKGANDIILEDGDVVEFDLQKWE